MHSTLYTLLVWGMAKHFLQVFYIQFEASIKSISPDDHNMISHWNLNICAPLKSLRPTEGTLILITSVQSNLVFTVYSLLVSLIRATQLTGTFLSTLYHQQELHIWALINKTRGLRRWPERETIVLRCKKFNPGSTELFEYQVRNSELFGTSVTTSENCVHKNSERYLIQNRSYSYFFGFH